MSPPDASEGGRNHGRHRAPDGDAQTAYIPRITDVSDDGVPGAPPAPPLGLGEHPMPPAAVAKGSVARAEVKPGPAAPAPRASADSGAAGRSAVAPSPSPAETAVLRTDSPVSQPVHSAA